MAEAQQLKLPSGKIIPMVNLPSDMTKARLQELLLRNKLAVAEDFVVASTESSGLPYNPTPRRGVGATGQGVDVGQFLQENMDIPAGIAGAVAGAKLAAPTLNPWLVGAAAIGGGAVGTFSGSLASDALTGEDLQYVEAVEKAAIGIGLDIATLGAARLLKGGYALSKKALGHTPEETAELILKQAKEGMEAGSRESLQATQNILTGRNASLSRSQTGQATALEVMAEKLGQSGILSEKANLEKVANVNTAIREALDDVINKVPMRGEASPREVGEAMYDTINAGRLALSDAYGESLGVIKETLSNKVVNTTPIKKRLSAYLNAHLVETSDVRAVGSKSKSPYSYLVKPKTEVISKSESSLDPATTKFINEKMKGLLQLPNMKATDVLEVDRMLSAEIRKFGDVNSDLYNTTAQKELGDVVDILKDSFINTIKQADTKAAGDYAVLKTNYKNARENLLPTINKNVIKKAVDDDYEALGKMLISQSNTSKVREFMKSIDESYKQLGRLEGLPSDIPYATAAEAKDIIKQGYLKNIFDDLSLETFDISKYKNLAAKYNRPANADMLRTITGSDYPRVKQLMNAMSEASKNPDGNLGTLFLRGKEYGAATEALKGAVTVAGYATGGVIGAAVTLGAILTAPVFLAKAAFNPKVVNKLLAFDKATFKTDSAKEKAMAVIIDDLVRGMGEYEAAKFRQDIQKEVDNKQQ
tara:strand:- start:211 stop:2322 length:2112 start_codon:yes stop_codon:yes gene_type:complete